MVAGARLFVAHAGMGSIIAAIDAGKPLLMLPRLHAEGEHNNDHQLATAANIGNRPGLHVAADAEDLKTRASAMLAEWRRRARPHRQAGAEGLHRPHPRFHRGPMTHPATDPILALQTTGDPLHYRLEVTTGLCVGHPDSQFLFGGAGMAAGLAAVEAATGRPTVWAAAQYLSYARPGTLLDFTVEVPVNGKYTTQARVTARDGTKEILTVNAALGDRPGFPEAQWAKMPEVPPPDACPPMDYNWIRREDDINSRFHQRVAVGRFGGARAQGGPSPDGIARMWVSPRDEATPVDRIALGVMADFLPSGVGNALGHQRRRQLARQHHPLRHAGADALGARRHPHPCRGAGLRPWPRASVCRKPASCWPPPASR